MSAPRPTSLATVAAVLVTMMSTLACASASGSRGAREPGDDAAVTTQPTPVPNARPLG